MPSLPLFPLNSVLLPHQLLPLHVFEDRYRVLARRCTEGDGQFGVVLIERGHEVGGGDVRVGVGTMARILESVELPDGRWLLQAVGTERFRVRRWLPDDPHPWAEVELWPDEPESVDPEAVSAVADPLRRLLALRAELGDPAPPATVELAADPAVASWQAAVLAGLTPLDTLAVLEAPGPAQRLDLLTRLLADAVELAQARLDLGG